LEGMVADRWLKNNEKISHNIQKLFKWIGDDVFWFEGRKRLVPRSNDLEQLALWRPQFGTLNFVAFPLMFRYDPDMLREEFVKNGLDTRLNKGKENDTYGQPLIFIPFQKALFAVEEVTNCKVYTVRFTFYVEPTS
jgi:hypothetical protein